MNTRSQPDISRRQFVQAGLAASALGRMNAAAPRRPNILYVFSDQQRASSIGAYGDPNVRTPALDAFSGQGARFDAAMSNTPVCCPHRACLQTGLYSHHHGVVTNGTRFTRHARQHDGAAKPRPREELERVEDGPRRSVGIFQPG